MLKYFASILIIFLGFASASYSNSIPNIVPGSFDNSTAYKAEQGTMVFEKALGLTYDISYIKVIGAKDGFVLVKYWNGNTKILPIDRIFNPIKYGQDRENLINQRTFDGSTSLGKSRYITVVAQSPFLSKFTSMNFQVYSAKVLSEENGYLIVQSTGGAIYKIKEQQIYQTKNGLFAGLRWGVGYYFVLPVNSFFNAILQPADHIAYRLLGSTPRLNKKSLMCAELFGL